MIRVTQVAGAVVLLAGLTLAITVVDHTGDVLVLAGQPLSLECTVDRSWQFCQWKKEGEGLCNLASSDKGEARNCTADGRVSLTMTDRTCGITVDSATMDDGGEFSCELLYSKDGPKVVTQNMTVEVVSELEMVRRENAELREKNTELETALHQLSGTCETGKG